MLSPELLQQIKRLELRTSHLVTEAMAGDYQSTFKGRGMEFEESRVYVPGDDVRNIDWNTTARTSIPFIENFREERELTIMLLVDVSASEFFGTRRRSKNEAAAEFAAILAHVAMRKNDRVGVVLFSDQIEEFIPPKKGKAHVWNVVRAVLAHEAKHSGTDIAAALNFVNKVLHRKAVVFLISDFLDEGFNSPLSITAKRHDLIAVTIHDPREVDIPEVGFIEFEDSESGEVFVFNSLDANARQAHTRWVSEKRRDLEKRFQGLKIDHIDLSTEVSTLDPLLKFFRKRLRKIRR